MQGVQAGQCSRGSRTDGAPPLGVHLPRHVQRIRVHNVLVCGRHCQDEAGGRLRCGGSRWRERGRWGSRRMGGQGEADMQAPSETADHTQQHQAFTHPATQPPSHPLSSTDPPTQTRGGTSPPTPPPSCTDPTATLQPPTLIKSRIRARRRASMSLGWSPTGTRVMPGRSTSVMVLQAGSRAGGLRKGRSCQKLQARGCCIAGQSASWCCRGGKRDGAIMAAEARWL